MFIISIRYLRSKEEVEDILPQDREFLEQHFSSGLFICAGVLTPDTGRIIITRGKSREQIESIMSESPFYRTSVGDFSIIEFTPTYYSPHLEL